MIPLVGATSVASSEAIFFKVKSPVGTGSISNRPISHEIRPRPGLLLEEEEKKKKLAADAAPAGPGSQ
jgi:hypothetical protein